MKVQFVLYGFSKNPIGGCKIVYEYANRLTQQGEDVTILFDCRDSLKRYHVYEPIRKLLVKVLVWIYPRWFPLSKKVIKKAMFSWGDNEIPNGDVIIATAAVTANLVASLSDLKGKKFYFIQDYENWNMNDEEVCETYRLGMKNIVISRWLEKIVDNQGKGKAVYIPNGIDFNIFNIDKNVTERNCMTVSMLYHRSSHKGSCYGIEALEMVKKHYPELKACLFGVPKRPEALPDWIEYKQNATQKELRSIYNNSAIFLCPTIKEGFGLTGAESMACGCALVSTEYEGVLEYATNDKNTLLSPVKDAQALAANIERLIEEPQLRIKLAEQGYQDIKKLDWNNSVKMFAETLREGNERKITIC